MPMMDRFDAPKTLTVGAGLCILLILALWLKSHVKTLNDTKIVAVDPPVFNFGTVFQAQTISLQFSLFNRSNRELRVAAIKPSCSCTVVADKVLGKTISPGEHLTIPVEYEVGERAGQVSSFISIYLAATNALEHLYEVRARMEGTALPEFTIEPDTIDFGSLKPGEKSSKTVTFRPGNAKKLEISDAVSKLPEFRISMQRNNSGSSDVPATAVITFQAPTNATRQETLSQVVQFKTSSGRVPRASVHVAGKIVPEVEIIPHMIVVPSLGLSEGGHTELAIRTSEPSRVMRLTRKGPSTTLDIQSSTNLATADAWSKTHHLSISNGLLARALGVNVELEVHGGADRIEARSAFVSIKSLNLQKRNNE